ncbi:MAG: hypothetical protein WDM84_02840 [Bauldia sp.]
MSRVAVGEGLRFLSGHAELWGYTPFAAGGQTDSWLATLRDVPFAWAIAMLTVAAVAIALPQARRSPALAAAVAAFLAHAAWIAAFQNPDHLRHLAPLAILGGVILALIAANGPPARWRTAGVALLLAANVAALASSGALRAAGPPPLAAAAAWLAAEPSGTAVATNDGVFLLRAGLPQTRVYDMHYPADASLGLATAAGAAFRLTGTPIAGQAAAAIFPGRFPPGNERCGSTGPCRGRTERPSGESVHVGDERAIILPDRHHRGVQSRDAAAASMRRTAEASARLAAATTTPPMTSTE